MPDLLADLRHASRVLARNPGFSAAAILTMGLGIGASTAAFSLVDAALFRPLPFADPGQVVVLDKTYEPSPPGREKLALDYTDWGARRELFSGVATYHAGELDIALPDGAVRVRATVASPNLLDILGRVPAWGRGFRADEAVVGNDRVAIVSDGLRERLFGRGADVRGRTVTVEGKPYAVVGVMPRGFSFPGRSEVWLPLSLPMDQDLATGFGHSRVWRVVGRLQPGVGISTARERVAAVERAFTHLHPSSARWMGMKLVPMRDKLVGTGSAGLLVLFGAAGLILLIACANTAALFLARAVARQPELALRAVLGAGRGRVAQQLLMESLLLAVAGCAAGLLLALELQRVLGALLPRQLLGVSPVAMGPRVLLFAVVATAAASLLSGVLPAMSLSRADLIAALRAAAHRASSLETTRLRSALASGELALVLVLLVGAGLTMKSLWRLQQVDPGFRQDGAISFTVTLPHARYGTPGAIGLFFNSLLERLQALPGVRSAGAVSVLPLNGGSFGLWFQILGRPAPREDERPLAELLLASPGYFETLGIPVLAGRAFTDEDRPDVGRVAMVSASLAHRRWPGVSPVGARIQLPFLPDTVTVVGVAGDVLTRALDASYAEGQLYLSSRQMPQSTMTIAVRATSTPAQFAAAIPHAVRDIDPTVAPYDVRTLEAVVADSIAPRRLTAFLLVIAAALASALAAVGIYAVIAYLVAQQTHEIGVRAALGASRGRLVRLVLARGARVTGLGAGIGLAVAVAAARVLSHLLFEVKATDVGVFAAATVLVSALAMLASYLPARRAARIEPAEALRTD